jgi:hypothetical protein
MRAPRRLIVAAGAGPWRRVPVFGWSSAPRLTAVCGQGIEGGVSRPRGGGHEPSRLCPGNRHEPGTVG